MFTNNSSDSLFLEYHLFKDRLIHAPSLYAYCFGVF